MRKKIRLIILIACIVLFLILAPYIVLYSMGYRVDFINMEVLATGGIYVRSYPQANQIIIDSKIEGKPGMFLNAFFVQDLLPKNHTVLVKKTGYFDYQKNILVAENQVTKIENILLIKQNIIFNQVAEKTNYFSVSRDNKNVLIARPDTKSISFEYFSLSNPNQKKASSLPVQNAEILDIKWSDDYSSKALIKIQKSSAVSYYIFDASKTIQQSSPLDYLDKNSQQISFNPKDLTQLFYVENKTLYSLKNNEATTVIKNIITYKISGSGILWLSSDGFLFQSDISGKLIQKITTEKAVLNPNNNYKLIAESGKTFLKENSSLYILNTDTKAFEDFLSPITNYEILSAPDNKNLLLANDSEIYLYSFEDELYEKIFLGSQIKDCRWLNNDYIIFTADGKIKISEIDYRGNINIISLPDSLALSAGNIIKNNPSQMIFNQSDGKIYILTENQLISSEKITQ
ncbi:MAG: hypothetical protein A2812_02065 [Candidatus Staskawiczbacteria bacterium RIFCSPHIGHO2_01_FULL_36_16]|uniref:PEGA domain-containing protein n=1 Tax=Candidatus Staskawiczbacteria bacterium RIFCSPHIGHO2_01_FULL_36_16 TaxID=1802200 RepID=A0A1G2HPZ8_9BACT|nr:MAG: hypothetical protein A2812_02065 [Candidatus Staskawiczbacteria bacterium RIFCSPHIGHO2_01_FULL_36_16]